MKLEIVRHYSNIDYKLSCTNCHRLISVSQETMYADIQGTPFVAYYCEGCAAPKFKLLENVEYLHKTYFYRTFTEALEEARAWRKKWGSYANAEIHDVADDALLVNIDARFFELPEREMFSQIAKERGYDSHSNQ